MVISKFDGEFEFLSNFHPCTVILHDGIVFPSVEHAYQAQKTLDLDFRISIANAPTAAKAKKMGRLLKPRDNWDSIKLGVMSECINFKFERDELAEKLLATGDQELIEGNWWGDTFWGVCQDIGDNWLGKLLMIERSKLRFIR